MVSHNLKEVRRRSGMILRVLANMGAMMRSHGMMYKAVAQSVLLYGSEIWVVMGMLLRVLEGLHHRAARRITGMTEKLVEDG